MRSILFWNRIQIHLYISVRLYLHMNMVGGRRLPRGEESYDLNDGRHRVEQRGLQCSESHSL